MPYLSYLPGRVRVWTEHPQFPYKAVEYWRSSLNGPFKPSVLEIYKISDDRSKIERIHQEEWPINED
jgi:hypothetical protein